MLEAYFIHDCTVYKATPDEYNNLRQTAATATKCHFRELRGIGTAPTNYEEESSDAMAWFKPAEDIAEGDLLTCQGKTYRVIRLVNARRLGNTDIQFKKTYLERFDSFIS